LRDLGRPEHVYALAHQELPSDLGPLRSLDTFPTNLPDQLTTFVGRARELSEVYAALDETRLLTLTGAGGAGKTRLALQLAADVLDRFPDGAWWVELAPLAEPQLVGEALAAALGVRPLPGMTALQASCAHLSERRALVLLDNCEHLLAACAEATEALLHGCPSVTVIATSRTPLAVAGETDWRVPSLSLPGPEPEREAIQALDQSDAVRLFIERARKARPNFAVSNENAPEVVRICQGLDGLPLAIELAAARVRMLSVEQIAAGLGDRFHLLTGGARTALPRHQTLRASVDWSHDLLSEPERVLFRRLSVFAGGFTLDACEEVGSGEGLERAAILDLLASLVDKSLVVAEERGPAVRYRLLETVREYAFERLAEAGERQRTRTRHRDAFLAFAERAAPELEGAGQCAWLELLDPEAGNLAAALEWAAQTDGERALRLCAALTLWWRFRGLFAAADVGFARALDVADPAPSALRARVLWGRAHLQTFMGRYAESLARAQQAMAMAEEVGDASTHARALDEIGAIQLWLAPVESRPLLERSCELARSAGDDWCLVYAGVNLGIAYLICDEHGEAQRHFDVFLPLAEQQGLRESIALALVGEGLNAVYRGDAQRGVERLDRALAESDALGEPVIEGLGHVIIGALELAQGRPEAALARLESSRERHRGRRRHAAAVHRGVRRGGARLPRSHWHCPGGARGGRRRRRGWWARARVRDARTGARPAEQRRRDGGGGVGAAGPRDRPADGDPARHRAVQRNPRPGRGGTRRVDRGRVAPARSARHDGGARAAVLYATGASTPWPKLRPASIATQRPLGSWARFSGCGPTSGSRDGPRTNLPSRSSSARCARSSATTATTPSTRRAPP
jgi:predicted ATPase